jgi:hypothetical protein
MKTKLNLPHDKSETENTNHSQRRWKAAVYGFTLTVTLLFGRWALAQSLPQPVLVITSTSSNQMVISITNAVSANYEVWTTPVLGNTTDYPWTLAAVGTNGQSSFTVPTGPYPAGFFMALLDTNAIPLWEAADPNNPSLGILTITIDSPTNGMVLQ